MLFYQLAEKYLVIYISVLTKHRISFKFPNYIILIELLQSSSSDLHLFAYRHFEREKLLFDPFNPLDLYGMFQIKARIIPFWILRVERVNSG